MSVTTIELLAGSLVVLVGASGSGKSSFAARKFMPTQILSSDQFRAMLCDDATNQSVSHDAFELLYAVARRRLALGRLTVVDATSAERVARGRLVTLAREAQARVVAVIFDLSFDECVRHDRERPERHVPPEVIANHISRIKESLDTLGQEGFDKTFILRSRNEADTALIIVDGVRVSFEGPKRLSP
jgi:protein phosphatase